MKPLQVAVSTRDAIFFYHFHIWPPQLYYRELNLEQDMD